MTNYYAVTYASIFGDDPNRRSTASGSRSGRHRRLRAGHRDDRRDRRGDQAGERVDERPLVARTLEGFRKVPTTGGRISFSRNLQRVRRQYRVIKVQDNKGSRVGFVTAKVVPKI